MGTTQIKEWQRKIGVMVDGNFGPVTLETSLDIYDVAYPDDAEPEPAPVPIGSVTGKDFLKLAATRIGEEYVYGADVDLDDPDWDGPWDCAEFCTWVVKQLTGKIYGCVNNNASNPDPYTGGWKQDVLSGLVTKVAVSKASKTAGGILLRYRPNGKHIVFSVGDGSTIEAKGTDYGVCRGSVGTASSWDYGILIKGVTY
jgi:N-acetylmuramoyl-L-alanine amidase